MTGSLVTRRPSPAAVAAAQSMKALSAAEPERRGPKVSVAYARRSQAVVFAAPTVAAAMIAAASACICGVGGNCAAADAASARVAAARIRDWRGGWARALRVGGRWARRWE